MLKKAYSWLNSYSERRFDGIIVKSQNKMHNVVLRSNLLAELLRLIYHVKYKK